MRNLIIKGMENIDGIKFHGIEGGFGKDKKAILVKDIANIHGRELQHINQNITRNRKRFKDGIDIIDLKGTEFAITLSESGIYTQNSINASSNIYLLSERGYAKLLKILEDDVAWEQYDKLVDGYFNMRKTIKYEQQEKTIKELSNMLEDFQKTVENNKETIKEYKSMCKINSSKKHSYSEYIKKRLGIPRINSEYEQVKTRVFFILNINKWEDIDLETSKDILKIIDESITIIKKERPYEQISYFD